MKYLGHTLIFFLTGLLALQISAQPQIQLTEFATGLNQPLSITNMGDERLFVLEQGGQIQIVNPDGGINAEPFLDISDRIVSGGEQGLLGMDFHPDYSNNGYFYVNYTNTEGNTHISRFSVSETDPDIALPDSEMILLSIDQPYTNHNGGNIVFGPDDYLYIGTGDGGAGGDPEDRAQDSTTLLGKMLRIDVDGGNPYGIPADNPFAGNPAAEDEIWALGMRNPWRFSFDRLTGDLWIADVGQNEYEEVNLEPAVSDGGLNYGWRCYEGNHEYNLQGCLSADHYTFPVHEYSHSATGGCSVTGGFVYRGTQYPAMQGNYFFADYCSDEIWTLYDDGGEWMLSSQGEYPGNNFSAFGEDADGELYITGISSGILYKISDTTTTGVQEQVDMLSANVYPNPFQRKINIETANSAEVHIYSTAGELLRTATINSDAMQLDLSDLKAGIYFMQFKQNGKSEYRKIIKK